MKLFEKHIAKKLSQLKLQSEELFQETKDRISTIVVKAN